MQDKGTPEEYDRFVTEMEKLIPDYRLITALDERTRHWPAEKKAQVATGLLAVAALLNGTTR